MRMAPFCDRQLVAAALLFLSSSSKAGTVKPMPVFNNEDEWMSVSPGIEFQAGPQWKKSKRREAATTSAIRQMTESRRGLKLWDYNTSHTGNPQYDSVYLPFDEEYDPVQQAWHLLGFYVDCGAVYSGDRHRRRRQMKSSDEEVYEDGVFPCPRVLLYAVYIDEEYEGTGVTEYQFYNRTLDTWNNETCGDTRCAKMDCHLTDTHFSLLGYFKCVAFDEWMEQLFKHEGYCVWNYYEYVLAQNTRNYLGGGSPICRNTGLLSETNETLYLGQEPLNTGMLGIGMYSDNRCSILYREQEFTLEDALDAMVEYEEQYQQQNNNNNNGHNSNDGNGNNKNKLYMYAQVMDEFNSVFEAFTICQPCIAYDFDGHSQSGNRGRNLNNGGNEYTCSDPAGYDSVNQCMKFRTKTGTQPAELRDVTIASWQDSIVQVQHPTGHYYGSGGYDTYASTVDTRVPKPSIRSVMLMWSSIVAFVCTVFWLVADFVLSVVYYCGSRASRLGKTTTMEENKKSPLLSDNEKGELT